MKFTVETKRTVDGWTVRIESPGTTGLALPDRSLGASGRTPSRFPRPLDASQEILALCDSGTGEMPLIARMHERWLAGDPEPPQGEMIGDVERFGRYLAAVLLGPHWTAIDRAAGAEPLELVLKFELGDMELWRLPWEMMFGAAVPLAADPRRDVAILRFVPGTELPVEAVTLPLRVLFVVGRQIDDALRPGAEYLGLLRQLRLSAGVAAQNAAINVRLLTEAAFDEIEEEMQRFHPHVVHFICHGSQGKAGGELLLTRRENDDPSRPKSAMSKPCDANTIFGLIGPRADGAGAQHGLPVMIVLNACHTGEIAGGVDPSCVGAVCQSLAGRLVALGVPMAIGMTGEVADGACRLFTQSFYRALVSGGCGALAAARGRRAAMLHYANYLSDAEWARPTLFARGETTFPLTAPDAAPLSGVLARYRKSSEPLFDRVECLCHYARFCAKAHAFCAQLAAGTVPEPCEIVLAFGVEDEEGTDQFTQSRRCFGKTPLFEDTAVQAVLDGFVPCILPSRGTEPPSDLADFALRVAEAMDEARDCFGKEPRSASESEVVAARICKLHPVQAGAGRVARRLAIGNIRKELRTIGDIGRDDALALKAAMAADFQRLRDDFGGERNPVLIIDDLHRYEGVLEPLRKFVVNTYGLGDVLDGGKRIAVPLIFTHSMRGAVGRGPEEIRQFLKGLDVLARRVPLGKLQQADERLALINSLLAMQPPVTLNSERRFKQQIEGLFLAVSKKTRGIPSLLLSQFVLGMVEVSKVNQWLIEADEEKIFEALNKRN